MIKEFILLDSKKEINYIISFYDSIMKGIPVEITKFIDRTFYAGSNGVNKTASKRLYLNLLKCSKQGKLKYDFAFICELEAQNDEEHHWFECSKIISFSGYRDIMKYLLINNLVDSSVHTRSKCQFAIDTLNRFFNSFHKITADDLSVFLL